MLSPDPKTRTIVTDARPLLTWEKLPDAAKYEVYWLVEDGPQSVVSRGSGETTKPQFRLTEDIVPNRQYEWGVHAFGKNGEELGYWASAYFFTAGAKETFAAAPKTPDRPKKGVPFLGVNPVQSPGNSGVAPGILIHNIGAGSPALKAGLLPGDVIIGWDGKPLVHASVPEFVNLVRSQSIGTTARIEFVRGGKVQSVDVTIEAKP